MKKMNSWPFCLLNNIPDGAPSCAKQRLAVASEMLGHAVCVCERALSARPLMFVGHGQHGKDRARRWRAGSAGTAGAERHRSVLLAWATVCDKAAG
jgi:hypothetical protein